MTPEKVLSIVAIYEKQFVFNNVPKVRIDPMRRALLSQKKC